MSGHVTGRWTGKKLSDYTKDGLIDFRGARAIVNGDVKRVGKEYASHCRAFLKALEVGGWTGEVAPEMPPKAKPQQPPDRNPQSQPAHGLFAVSTGYFERIKAMKYVKPKSLTWWASVAPSNAAGLVCSIRAIAWAGPKLVQTIDNVSGNTSSRGHANQRWAWRVFGLRGAVGEMLKAKILGFLGYPWRGCLQRSTWIRRDGAQDDLTK